ncbi:lanthionine synthetase C family protein [Thermomonospora cellulosilytica]|uniref:Lanthionine synthetase C family protein n=1 Tax=Thermomonospora cellulosilytica TaxID=1411118 RepID=A0A7W3MVX0_9ACTN|nr:lanthionine synthetase C family protein [Thermomonospora cellulosilytica]MBA9002858.1 hypothetical protein [Thermomonospora cellulosilytica]
MTTPTMVEAVVAACLERLPALGPPPENEPWAAHSLTRGAAGIALAHVERAHQGACSWPAAHAWIVQACAGQVSASPNTGLFQGLPAIAFLLHATGGRYRGGLADIARPLADLVHQRATDAHARIIAGRPTEFREYDVFFGLTGLGALLLRLDPGGGALEHLLTALVALTRPVRVDGVWLPGWWVGHDPHRRRSAEFPGGHANLGMAHGITGPLALLALTARNGLTVDGHDEAIAAILAFLDDWRQDGPHGPWWPQWISRADHANARPSQTGPGRPSWCYGTPGIARAGQLAALATTNTTAQHAYETALAACLADPAQQNLITDPGLCHGAAGLYQTAWHAARDAAIPTLAAHLPQLADRLTRLAALPHEHGPGFLDGDAGTLLALHTLRRHVSDPPPASGWDACLLLT